MSDKENVIKGLEETEIMLTQAIDRGGEMAVIGACKCLNRVSDAIALLKEHKNEYGNDFSDAMLGKQELMYEGTDGEWHKKDW